MAKSALILDRYRVIERAGSGGYGTVQHAFDTHLKRDVAIKCIPLSEDEVTRSRLLALEAQMEATWGEPANFLSGFPADPAFLNQCAAQRGKFAAQQDAQQDAQQAGAEYASESENAAGSDDLAGAGETLYEIPPWIEVGASTESGAAAQGVKDANIVDAAGSATIALPYHSPTDELISAQAAPHVLEPDDPFDHIPGLQEARSAAKLNDAHIVGVYDCVVEGSTAYVVMEYIEGKTLAEIIAEMGDDMTLDVVAATFSSIAHALDVAHDQRTLHLDIKPENVIVNAKGQVKVTDFGLAALMDAAGTGTAGGGTIGYMPPEQILREPLDVRTDEWALASLTYEMLTGSNPFVVASLDEAQEAIEESELILPSLCWDDLDEEADDIIFAALDPDQDERFETVGAFADALSPFLGSAKVGTQVLASVVTGVPEEEPVEEEQVREPLPPLVDRVGLKGAGIMARAFCALSAGLLGCLGAANMANVLALVGADMPLVYGIVALVCAIGAAAKPAWAPWLGYGVLTVGLLVHMAWAPALVLVAAVFGWWKLVGHRGFAQVACGMAQPLFGAIGGAAVQPIMCGVFLPTLQSMLTAAFAFVIATVMGGCGSFDLLGWDIIVRFMFNDNPQAGFIYLLSQASTWVTGASWIAAAGVYSLCCLRGTERFDILGSVLAAVVLIVGVCVAAHLSNFGGSWVPSVSALLGVLVPGIMGVVAAIMCVPDRARWAQEEWEYEE